MYFRRNKLFSTIRNRMYIQKKLGLLNFGCKGGGLQKIDFFEIV
jgi:hypothetical protein